MYIINMTKDNPTIFQLKEERLHILFGKIVNIRNWDAPCYKAPFWRCYCPFETGGHIIYRKEKFSLLPGEGYIIPPFTDFAVDLENDFTKAFCHFAYELPECSFLPGIYLFNVDDDIFQELIRIKNFPEKTKGSIFELMMLRLVSCGLANLPNTAMKEKQIDPRVNLLLNYIKKNEKNGISNSKLAETVHLTVPSMIRLFNNNMDISPQKYQKSLRLQHASTLLVHTNMSLEEIADECGFWDRNHFSCAFRKFLQCPPAEYRKINRG
jgi:AraC-like DNA-binding protein